MILPDSSHPVLPNQAIAIDPLTQEEQHFRGILGYSGSASLDGHCSVLWNFFGGVSPNKISFLLFKGNAINGVRLTGHCPTLKKIICLSLHSCCQI